MSSLDLYEIKNGRTDLKHPRYGVTIIARTNCKDCDCAQRLVRCLKATPVEQHCTIFA
jgi:hypothetical protein